MKSIVRNILVLLLASIALSGVAQNNNIFIQKENNPELRVTVTGYFGISLITTHMGFVRYGFIQIKSTGEQKITWLSREQFMSQVAGEMVSKANPEKKNLLEEKKISASTFDNLWKLRYAEYPYDGSNEKGWAGKDFMPSDAQLAFLKRNYHYNGLDQFFYGEDMWRLIKDMQDPNWQNQYSSLK
ncbi:MAG: hypothetical protein MJ204_09790 [Bacteroidales bacterium]|nr:hypothetical protein [Bacteroidales bacterium]